VSITSHKGCTVSPRINKSVDLTCQGRLQRDAASSVEDALVIAASGLQRYRRAMALRKSREARLTQTGLSAIKIEGSKEGMISEGKA
jgi:hypothetical protein